MKKTALLIAFIILLAGCAPRDGEAATTTTSATSATTETTTTATTSASTAPAPEPDTLRWAYEPVFGYVGNAVNTSMFSDPATRNFIKKHYNSVTAENETKPESLLGKAFLTKEEAIEQGYYVPEGYTEDKIPSVNFGKIDAFLQAAHENGLKVRFHTLVWHQQSPNWFFKEDYNNSNPYVAPEIMDKREEMYIKSLIKHVYESPYGSGVYAWDVVNEYLNSGNNGHWNKVYAGDKSYVLNAFKYASDELTAIGRRDGVKLFYNDYNTYEKTKSIIELIGEINRDGQYCDGVGMQMHLDVGYPSIEKIAVTVDKFKEAGFEIQITELDATLNGQWYSGPEKSEEDQTAFYGDLFKMLIEKKEGGANITSLTFWGLYDGISWRKAYNPLIFTGIDQPKDAFYAVMEAAKR